MMIIVLALVISWLRIISGLSIDNVIFSSQGISSLCRKKDIIFAGTKRGDVLILNRQESHTPYNPNPNHANNAINIEKADEKAYPVYSVISSTEFLFCGCGDRYISVFQKVTTTNRCSLDALNYTYKLSQRLGPHTGWVKDLYYDAPSSRLFSIGCNCIETWEYKSFKNSWEHVRKRSIDSSPSQGSTLSSDLLCLCGPSGRHSNTFFAGGVDGRIHTWSTDPIMNDQPLASIGAHAGRLTCLMISDAGSRGEFSSSLNLLFSSGHDGVLQCRIVGNDGLATSVIAAILVGDSVRVTAGDVMRTSEFRLSLILGCSNGYIKHVLVEEKHEDGSVTIQMTQHGETLLSVDISISSVLFLPPLEDQHQSILIGHSKGLNILGLPLKIV